MFQSCDIGFDSLHSGKLRKHSKSPITLTLTLQRPMSNSSELFTYRPNTTDNNLKFEYIVAYTIIYCGYDMVTTISKNLPSVPCTPVSPTVNYRTWYPLC